LGANEEKVLKALRTNMAFFQKEVASRVSMKYAAKLKFLADDSFDQATHIESLLAQPKVQQDLTDEADGDDAE
jgi:ribosome-binding factor A